MLNIRQTRSMTMSDFKNSKRVKLSSVKSGIKPEDDDDASTAKQKQPIAGCSHIAKRKTPEKAPVTATATATSDTAKGSVLIEDVLILIFETDFLDTADLLQFRLVNRSWRDCATSVLLRTSACQISFNIRSVPNSSNVDDYATKAVYCNKNNEGALLEDLNEIISHSPKFPCSSFRFVNKYSFGDPHHQNRIDTSSLQKFFLVHGKNVKTITVGDLILKKDLSSLLLNYTPFLECLDLQYLYYFGNRDKSVYGQPLFSQSVILPNLKTVILGPYGAFNLLELVDAAINLQSVENTRTDDLRLLLDHGKVGLIKKLKYCLHVYSLEAFSVFEELAERQLKLTILIVSAARDSYVRDLPGTFLKMQMFLNKILESSKDTLKYLEFRICPFADIKFPILKNLSCLKLVQSGDQDRGLFNTLPSSVPNVLPLERGPDFQFDTKKLSPNRPCNSFPNLQKLQLDIQNYGIEKAGSLLLLHTCRSHNKEIVPHSYNTVNVLELYSALPKTIERAESVSNLFPNVTILKIKCETVKDLNCYLWALSPLAKFIEIYGMSKHYSNHDGVGGGRSVPEDVSNERMDEVGLVDSFFTGFPIELCKKLKKVNQFPMEIEESPSLQNFLRVMPSMCDLKDLQDFKILFTELKAPFFSHVSEFYAFRNMPTTKITFAHAPLNKCTEAECEMKNFVAPISTFVHFTHMNAPKRFGKNTNIYLR